MQVLNVALGGTLFQDLPSQMGVDVLKHRQATPKWEPTHEVEVTDGFLDRRDHGPEMS